MKRSIGSAGDLVQARSPNGFRIVPLLVSLTYRGTKDWHPRHVSRCIEDVKRHCRRFGFDPAHVWVMELQKRGAPHYHVIVWVRSDIYLPDPARAGWWPYGFSDVKRAKKAVGYLLSYATKLESKHSFPHGARIHGRGGLSRPERGVVRWWVLPRYQRDRCSPEDWVERAKGGGWVSRLTGEWWPPWNGWQRLALLTSTAVEHSHG